MYPTLVKVVVNSRLVLNAKDMEFQLTSIGELAKLPRIPSQKVLFLCLLLLNMKNTDLVHIHTAPFSSISIETVHAHQAPCQ